MHLNGQPVRLHRIGNHATKHLPIAIEFDICSSLIITTSILLDSLLANSFDLNSYVRMQWAGTNYMWPHASGFLSSNRMCLHNGHWQIAEQSWEALYVRYTAPLTHLHMDKMATILADDNFKCIVWHEFEFHWNLFPGVQLIIIQHWLR